MKTKITTLLACSALSVCAFAAENNINESVAVSSSQFNVVKAKTDVLGRHNPNYRATPRAFVRNNKINQNKTLQRITDVTKYNSIYAVDEPNIYPITGEYSYIKRNGANNYSAIYKWCGDDVSADQYKNLAEYYENVDPARKYYEKGYVATGDERQKEYDVNITAKDVLSNYNTYHWSELNPNVTSYTSHDFVDRTSVIENDVKIHTALKAGRTGKGIGIHLNTDGVPSAAAGARFIVKRGSTGGTGTSGEFSRISRSTETTRLLNKLSGGATVYTYDARYMNDNRVGPNHPESMKDKNKNATPVMVGLTTYGKGKNYTYSEAASKMDDYVYNTRVIEIASAGNLSNYGAHNYISDVAMGANVISVGAISPVYYGTSYFNYSDWHNVTIGGGYRVEMAKPEVLNFTDIFFNTEGLMNYTNNVNQLFSRVPAGVTGTEGAAALTTCMVVDLLSYNAFYKWHPEVMKALLISASDHYAQNTDIDNDQSSTLAGKNWASFDALRFGNRSRFWNGTNASANHFNNQDVITFQEKDIVTKRKYRVAIAWLSKGSYILNEGALPQDIDLKVCQGSNNCVESNTSNNPYEVVEFTAANNNPITVTITRYRNNGGHVLLGYNMHEVQ